MSAAAPKVPWPGFDYKPTPIVARLASRQQRYYRKMILRFLASDPKWVDFYDRLRALVKNPRLNGAQKWRVYQGIEHDYIQLVTKGAAPLAGAPPETNNIQAEGTPTLEVHPAGTSGSVDNSDNGPRDDTGAGVQGLATEIVGDG